MSVPGGQPELLKAQYAAFGRHMPVMYFSLVVNTWALALTHRDFAPVSMTLYFPIGLTLVCLARMVTWSRAIRKVPTEDVARDALNRTNRIGGVIAAVFLGWSMMLYPYGDAFRQGHVAFYMAITMTGCIFCLMHLRSAALTLAVIVNLSFVLFFGWSGNPVFIAMAINVALVSLAMLMMLGVSYRDFERLVASQVETRLLSDENLRLAHVDSLTGLPNRRSFFSVLKEVFAACQRNGDPLMVGILDLDGFKPVNDVHGHSSGDELLAGVAARLKTVCGETIFLSRLGGDEFALIMPRPGDADWQADLGRRLLASIETPFLLDAGAVRISVTGGFARYPDLASDAETLFEYADYALYHGKRQGRGTVTLFSAEHEADIRRNAEVEQALRNADLDRELDLKFQPIVDLVTRQTLGFEALARWTSPELGLVAPTFFVPMAERIGMIEPATRVLLRKALGIALSWPQHLFLSFNLSAKDIVSPQGVQRIVEIIRESGFDPKRLDMEITETAVIQDFAQARAGIERFQALGCGISLDDFGTGHSTLSQLHALPLTKFKIDRSFVTRLHENPTRHKIVKSLLALGRDMEIGCIIEGVETEEECAALIELKGCTAQGYLFSRPIGAQDIAAFLRGSLREPPALSGQAGPVPA